MDFGWSFIKRIKFILHSIEDFLDLYTSGCLYFSSDPGPFIVSSCPVTHYWFSWIRQECTVCKSCFALFCVVLRCCIVLHWFVKISTDICPFLWDLSGNFFNDQILKLKKLIWKGAYASRRLLHFGIVLPTLKDRQELVFKSEKSQQTVNSFWQGISRAGDLGWGMMGRKPGARQLDWKPHHPLPPLSSVSPSSPALI